jgi:hypothetical protein
VGNLGYICSYGRTMWYSRSYSSSEMQGGLCKIRKYESFLSMVIL